MINKRQYECENCGETFESEWTEEEAIAEAKKNFGDDWDMSDKCSICDDCYNTLMRCSQN